MGYVTESGEPRRREGRVMVVRDVLRAGSSTHRHNDMMLGIHDKGWHRILRGGRSVVIPARRFCVFWAMTPYQSQEFPAGTTSYYATLPLQQFLAWRMPAELQSPLLSGAIIGMASEAWGEDDVALFRGWHHDLQSGSAYDRIVLLEMEARLRRLAVQMGERHEDGGFRAGVIGGSEGEVPASSPVDRQRPSSATGKLDLDHVAGMARFIAENYQHPIGVPEVAASVQLHPHYAMQLFRREYGYTLLDYLSRHRVWAAQRLLLSSDLKASEVSRRCGFGSEERLYPVFRKYCGCTPREYRKSNRHGV